MSKSEMSGMNDPQMQKLAAQAKEITDSALSEGLQTMALEMMSRLAGGKYSYGPKEIHDIMEAAQISLNTALSKFIIGLMISRLKAEASVTEKNTGDPAKFEDLLAKFGGLGDIGDERDIAKN